MSGFCAAQSVISFTFYMKTGYALHGGGMKLDAIAAAVIGGVLLTGGVGYVFGSLFGVLIFGAIQYLMMFQGTLSAWWARIAIGFMVFVFCLLQKFFIAGKDERKSAQNKIMKAETVTK